MNSSLRVKKYRKLMSFGSSAMNWLVVVSNGSSMLTPNAFSAPGALDARLHDPGPGAGDDHPVERGHRGGELAGLHVERVVGLRAGRAEDRDLARGAVRREHVEGVAHLLQRGVGDLEIAAVGAVACRAAAPTRRARRSGRRRRDRRPARRARRPRRRARRRRCGSGGASSLASSGSSSGPASSASDASGRAPRWLMTSAAASAPRRAAVPRS